MRPWRVCVFVGLALIGCGFRAPQQADGDGGVDAPPRDGDLVGADADAPPDRDADGVLDLADNCPDAANPGQADEDADTVGNACDNCPHLANTSQADELEIGAGQAADGVGDACDPEPTAPGNSIALFLPFDDAAEIATWQSAGNNAQFVVSQGQLEQRGATDLAILWKNGLGFAEAWITTEVTYNTIDAAQQFRGATVMTRFERSTMFGTGVGCGEMRDSGASGGQAFFTAMRFEGGGFQHQVAMTGATVQAGHTARYQVHRTSGANHECVITPGATYVRSLSLTDGAGTGINFAVWGATVAFKYLVVID